MIEGFYDSKEHVIYLHLQSQHDACQMAQLCQKAAQHISSVVSSVCFVCLFFFGFFFGKNITHIFFQNPNSHFLYHSPTHKCQKIMNCHYYVVVVIIIVCGQVHI